MGWNLRITEQTISTNADVRRTIDEGAPEGYAVLALSQTKGYGRRGTPWASPDGGMYLSVLLRPTRPLEEWPTLSLLAAVALRRMLANLLPGAAEILRIKYPNDIVVQLPACAEGVVYAKGTDTLANAPLKLAGILPENHAGAVALGFGLNVLRPSGFQPPDTRNVPVFLQDLQGFCGEEPLLPPDMSAYAQLLLQYFQTCYCTWLEQGFSPFEGEYETYAMRT